MKNGQDYKPGVHVGAFVEYPLSYYKKFALQLELMYSMQGYKGIEYDQYDLTTYKINGTERLEDVTHHYLYLPLQVKYYVSDNFSVELGGQVGFYMVAASGQYDMNRYNPVRNLVNLQAVWKRHYLKPDTEAISQKIFMKCWIMVLLRVFPFILTMVFLSRKVLLRTSGCLQT
ncbi:porin family protein [Myroides ceti]|uniref:Porin family protein n=1 Tax=Paenimyroides ceti TaxID=395087 RepID=A0ABT8CXI9_9FLAO|nr:porin family protein [Paenimyroides ceti]MDN3709232.1 porin family protein [Paenimyroides ceti]